MSKSTANNSKSLKPRGGSWKKGQSGNPKGRPKDGESWSAIIADVGNMYSSDLLSFIGEDNELGQAIAKFPKNVQLKYLVVSRVFAALMFDPTSGLLKEFMDRLEGKVAERVDMTSGGEKLSNLSDEEKIMRIIALVNKAKDVDS